MNKYFITKSSNGTTITLPTKAKYQNKLNNTLYYSSRREQCVKTHILSWKKISTVYLDTITLNTENITDDTQFTFNFRNDNTDKTIQITVKEDLTQFASSITRGLTAKYFYLVDLDNVDKFNTHILDFINTVLIDLTSNTEILNELIEETPTEPETTTEELLTNIIQGLPQAREGNLTLQDGKEVIPVLLNKNKGTNHDSNIHYTVIFTDTENRIINIQENTEYKEFTENLVLHAIYNGEQVQATIKLTDAAGIADITIQTEDTLGTLQLGFTPEEESTNYLTITEIGE